MSMSYAQYQAIRAAAVQRIAMWKDRLKPQAGAGVSVKGNFVCLDPLRRQDDTPPRVFVTAVYVTADWTHTGTDGGGDPINESGTFPRDLFGWITDDGTQTFVAAQAFDFRFFHTGEGEGGEATWSIDFEFESRTWRLGTEGGFEWEKGVYGHPVEVDFVIVNETAPGNDEHVKRTIRRNGAKFHGTPSDGVIRRLLPSSMKFA